ncbi:hypothetical protein BJX64DRAFT_264981 [Aspergillus heterothallicus]
MGASRLFLPNCRAIFGGEKWDCVCAASRQLLYHGLSVFKPHFDQVLDPKISELQNAKLIRNACQRPLESQALRNSETRDVKPRPTKIAASFKPPDPITPLRNENQWSANQGADDSSAIIIARGKFNADSRLVRESRVWLRNKRSTLWGELLHSSKQQQHFDVREFYSKRR